MKQSSYMLLSAVFLAIFLLTAPFRLMQNKPRVFNPESNNQYQENNNSIKIYITQYGKFYHIESCKYVKLNNTLKNNLREYNLNTLNLNKYTPCKHCNPPLKY